MMQDVHVHLNPELPWLKGIQQEGRLFFIWKLDLNLRNKLVKNYIWSVALYGDETWDN